MQGRLVRWGVGLALLALLGWAWTREPGAWLLEAVARLRDQGTVGLVAFAALYAAATVLLLPAGLLTLAAGFAWGVAGGAVAVWAGATAGAVSAFLLGRTVARETVTRRLAQHGRLRAIDRAVRGEGFKLVLLLRLSPVVPFGLLNYGLGVTAVSARDYTLATALGIVPGMIVYLWVGSTLSDLGALAQGAPSAGGPGLALSVVGLVSTVAVTAVITRLARRALSERLDDPEE